MSYKVIEEYYLMGLFTEKDLDSFVKAKWITEEQKKEIMGKKAVMYNHG